MAELKSAAHPSAVETVAFLFADLEGSTRLLARLGADRYGEALGTYRALTSEAAAAQEGELVDSEGDGLFIVFPTAARALRAAAAAQRALAAHAWPEGVGVAARIGIHAGEARHGTEGWLGLDVHRAARIASAAHGGQTLVSEAARLLALDGLPDELELRDLGKHRLKDLDRFERLHQLVVPGTRHDFPPPRTLEGKRSNLPVQTTSFVGREAELAQLVDLVRSGRLVTVTGVGGSGKTRLAIHVAAELAPEFTDGVWLVELGAVADPQLVDGALLETIGLSQGRGVAPRAAVLEGLAGWHALIILDNCEHLIDAAADLSSALLGAVPGVTILATSRELLGVAGEQIYSLRSLAVPKDDSGREPESLLAHDAVRLFAERAAAVLPGFRLDPGNARAVVEICRRLDGMPLALELAAPRLRTFSADKLAALLDQRFRLLTGGSRTALPRQQTLNATIDWSYRLLSDAERAFFRRLSVFQGGFSYEQAAAVCAGGEVSDVDALELLPALVDKSLVVADSDGGEVRYRLLETIRQFARERLDESGEGDSVRHRHGSWFHGLALEAARNAIGPSERDWRNQVNLELDNLRQAMTWLLEVGQPVAGLEMAVAFSRFVGWSEALAWLERALDPAWPAADKLHRARALSVRGQMRDQAGQFDDATVDIEQAIALFRELEAEGTDPESLVEFPRCAAAFISLAVALFHQGRAGANNEIFTELVQEGLAVARRLRDGYSTASALGNLAHHMDPAGDPQQARQLFAEAVAATRAVGSDQLLAIVNEQRAYFEFQAGDLEASRAAWRAAIEHAERAGQGGEIHVLRAYLAATEVEMGIDAASSFVSSMRALLLEPGTRAAAWVYQALIVFRAGIDAARREFERVAVAAGASAAEAGRGSPVRWDLVRHFERVTGDARAALGEERFQAVAERGSAMSRDEIIEFLAAD